MVRGLDREEGGQPGPGQLQVGRKRGGLWLRCARLQPAPEALGEDGAP